MRPLPASGRHCRANTGYNPVEASAPFPQGITEALPFHAFPVIPSRRRGTCRPLAALADLTGPSATGASAPNNPASTRQSRIHRLTVDPRQNSPLWKRGPTFAQRAAGGFALCPPSIRRHNKTHCHPEPQPRNLLPPFDTAKSDRLPGDVGLWRQSKPIARTSGAFATMHGVSPLKPEPLHDR